MLDQLQDEHKEYIGANVKRMNMCSRLMLLKLLSEINATIDALSCDRTNIPALEELASNFMCWVDEKKLAHIKSLEREIETLKRGYE